MHDKERTKIIETLNKKGATKPCSRCGKESFTLLRNYYSYHEQPDLNNTVLGGPRIPCIGTVCNHCGHISMHALGALEPLPEQEETSD